MKRKMMVNSLSDRLESELHEALHEHTTSVDLSREWSRVAPQLFTDSEHGEQRSVPGIRVLRWKALPMAAVLALICFLLLGAGGVAAYGIWWRWASPNTYGSPAQYTVVNQQQSADGVTVTVTRVYADADRTIIAFDVVGPTAWVQKYSSVAPQSLSLQSPGSGKAALTRYTVSCNELAYGGFPMHCIAVFAALQPKTNAKTLTLLWNVDGFVLTGTAQSLSYAGHWHFRFTLPFLWQNHTPDQPQIRPAHT